MSISLVKGQKIDLTKGNAGLKKVVFALGWDTNRYDGDEEFDLDVSAFFTDDSGKVTVNLEKMPSDVEKIVFVVNIYACTSRKQDFGLIKNAFIRLVDDASRKEICKYNLSENYAGKTAMVFAEVYKKDGEWKFNAIGQGTNDTSISELANRYK